MANIMEYIQVGPCRISRLTLGTVALGMPYGISNPKGQPLMKDGRQVLDAAFQAGITTLDTARSYGQAERLIGTCLSGEQLPVVVTKFKLSAAALEDRYVALVESRQSIRESLQQLGLKCIPICLFHMERSMSAASLQPVLHRVFSDLKKEGLIDIAGVSVEHPDALGVFVEDSLLEAFQVPLNILDLRLLSSGLLSRLSQAGKIVFARSIYLQGLFFMDPKKLKGNLLPAAKYLEQLRDLAASQCLSIQEIAFSFVAGLQEVSSMVVGAVSPRQVSENVSLLHRSSLDPKIMQDIRELFSQVPEDILTPASWVLPSSN